MSRTLNIEDMRQQISDLKKRNFELVSENTKLHRCLQKLSDYYELHGSWDTFKRIVATCEEGEMMEKVKALIDEVYRNQWFDRTGIESELKAAEEALEKQTAKKAFILDGESWKCPSCEISFCEMYEWDYCPNCGQKLDWSV